MNSAITQVLKEQQIHTIPIHDITACFVDSPENGIGLSKALLYAVVNRRSMLYLSGGKTPKELYAQLAKEELLDVGAVGMIDERFGMPFHKSSNELLLRDSGLLRYLQMRDIPFHSMLQLPVTSNVREKSHEDLMRYGTLNQVEDDTKEVLVDWYDQEIREWNTVYQSSIGLLGIGADGHTAGILPESSELRTQNSKHFETDLVIAYESNDQFRERITQTFLGLSMLDLIIVLVLGKEKETALHAMFAPGDEQTVPARFYKRPEIAKKTVLITDQEV